MGGETMRMVYELYTSSGIVITDDVEPETPSVGWYRIRKHNCRNDEQQPCDPWEIVAEFGEIPEDDL